MSFKDDILSASEDTKNNRFSLKKFCEIPRDRFSTEPFKFVAFSADLSKMSLVVIITTLISFSFFMLIGFIWGVYGFFASMAISTIVNIAYTGYMIRKRKNIENIYTDINKGLDDNEIVQDGNYWKATTPESKTVLSRVSEVVNFLYYDNIYNVYKDSAETSSVSWWLMALFCALLVFVTQSYSLAYASVALLATRLIYDVVRLYYIRTAIVTLGIFYEKLQDKINSEQE